MRPLLADASLVVRPLELTDVEAVCAAVIESIPEVSRWLPWCHPGYTSADTKAFIQFSLKAWAEGSQFPFGIFDSSQSNFLGGIGINHIARGNRLASVGYWVRTSSTGRGIASSAARLVARYAFDQLGFTRLEIAAIPGNIPSRRAAEKAGARFEAISRNRLVMHGRAYDAALYALVPEDLASTS